MHCCTHLASLSKMRETAMVRRAHLRVKTRMLHVELYHTVAPHWCIHLAHRGRLTPSMARPALLGMLEQILSIWEELGRVDEPPKAVVVSVSIL